MHEYTSIWAVPPSFTFRQYIFAQNVLRVSSFYRGADTSLARPTSQCILFDGENISFDASLVIYRVSQNLCHKLFLGIPHPQLSKKVPINK
jgi:hypothetical protein